ncbi:MAG TPA: AAA family ATPase [Solirubrobacterales bacterium]|nr:AAA family ATPase [Solirubrobacterales bacterium]
MAAGSSPPLIEREQELAAIESALEAARSGTGALLLVEGPAGIGKTSLLREALQAAAEDMLVLRGVGTTFEREYPFGVLKQALAPVVRSEGDRKRLLVGAARLAEPALLDVAEDAPASPFGILNGLYWLLAALAEERPVLLVVDDAHWADEPSLRFLGFLARRLDSVGVAVMVGVRTAADFSATPALAEVRDHARAHGGRVEPRALDEAGVAQLVAEVADRPVDDAFASACHRATGGNPFLLDELLRALLDTGSTYSAAEAERVAELSVPGVTASVKATLDRLGPDANALARTAAVLGEGAALDLAAELAGVEPAKASRAASELAGAGILERGTDLRFRHPLLAGAVRDGIAEPDLAEAHARAADMLRERGAPAERIALQLLHVLPEGEARVVEELRQAARRAVDQGAPAIAVRLLERALREPPSAEERSELLLELGRSELDEGRVQDASKRLLQAHGSAEDPILRGRAAALLAMAVPGEPEERRRIVEIVRATYDEVAPLDRELGLRLQSILVLEGPPSDDLTLQGETVAEGVFLGTLVFNRMDASARADDIVSLAMRGARQADALLNEGAIGLAFTGIVLALRWGHRLAEAEALLDRALEAARRRGSTADFAMAMTLRATVRRVGGRLREAEADARSALPATLDDRWGFARGIQPLVGSLLDQGRTDEAASEMAAMFGEDSAVPDSPPMLPVLLIRMALNAARRDHIRALADWDEAVRRAERFRGITAGWIEDLGVAAGVHDALGDSESARATANRMLDIARCWDTPGAIGQALLAQARVGAVDEPIENLGEAVSLLAESPLRLEHAKALVALGAFMRREGRRTASREPLREGYELAVGCGAAGLAEAARAELRASGVRVRREPRSGADELTASEERIAGMAAEGLSNAEIAQELFLTVKTVEMHLTQSYRKLGIRGRRELAAALAQV